MRSPRLPTSIARSRQTRNLLTLCLVTVAIVVTALTILGTDTSTTPPLVMETPTAPAKEPDRVVEAPALRVPVLRPAAVPNPAAPPSPWIVSVEVNPMTDQTDVSVSQAGTVLGGTNAYTWMPARLHLRCRDKETDLYVTTDRVISGTVTDWSIYAAKVRYRIGDGSATPLWGQTNEVMDTFYAGNNERLPLARELAAAGDAGETVRFEVPLYGGGPLVVEFDLTGLRTYAEQVAEACGWQL